MTAPSWTEDPYNGRQAATVGELSLSVNPPPAGLLHPWQPQWQVAGFVTDRNIADVLAHGEAPTLELAKAAALEAAARIAGR